MTWDDEQMRVTPGCGFWAVESVEFQFWLHLSLAGEGSMLHSHRFRSKRAVQIGHQRSL